MDKLIARRMKNQGMRWTIKGIRSLLCVRFLVLEGKLKNLLLGQETQKASVPIPRRKVRSIVRRSFVRNPGEWLQV